MNFLKNSKFCRRSNENYFLRLISIYCNLGIQLVGRTKSIFLEFILLRKTQVKVLQTKKSLLGKVVIIAMPP